MANTVTLDANRQELWSKDLMVDVMRDVENIMRFTTRGGDGNGVVQIKDDLAKKKGDLQDFTLIARLKGDGVTGDNELEGNEEKMISFNEQVAIDQIRNAVRLKGQLDAQKVVYNSIAEAREILRIWLREFIARQMFFKLGGVNNTLLVDTTGVTIGGRALWSNTPDFIPDADTAYTGSRARYMNAAGATAVNLVAGDTMTLDIVTDAAALAKLANPKIQMIEAGGDSFYVMYLHTYQARDIKKSSDWKTANQNARERSAENPVFKGALGFWSNVLLLENEYVPWLDISSAAGNSFRGAASGTNFGVDTARALLCGRQAVLWAQASNPTALVVETFDYGNKDGVAVKSIGGIQKAVFDSKEFGVVAVDTAAAAA